MRNLLCMLLCLMMALPALPAAAETPEEAALYIQPLTGPVRPGKAILLSFRVPADGECEMLLRDAAGAAVLPVVTAHPVSAGMNHLWWNGTFGGMFAPEGEWTLALGMDGMEASVPVVIGPAAPYITGITSTRDMETRIMRVDFYASVDGLLTVGVWADDVWTILQSRKVSAGMNGVTWDASGMAPGTTALTLTLTDDSGFSSNEEHVAVCPADFGIATPTPTEVPTPTPTATPTAS
ncbi:MAG: hypothetical protein IJ343_07845, partial [Clostridia bacterium]|nr:hypothetical protein [Clostridia bacterium]